MRNAAFLLAGLAFATPSGAGATGAEPLLSGAALDRAISGRRIFLATPMGGEFPLNYYADGRVDGQGEAAGLGRFARPTDSGRWWIRGEKLCQKWASWYDGKVFCFTLQKAGEDRLTWRRDDGLSGVARIGR
jgi:hypothetical protein